MDIPIIPINPEDDKLVDGLVARAMKDAKTKALPKVELPIPTLADDLQNIFSFTKKPGYFDSAETASIIARYLKKTDEERIAMTSDEKDVALKAFALMHEIQAKLLKAACEAD